MIRNERGFTLVEALIAALILGMVILVWSSLEVFTSSVVKKVSSFSNAQKVIINIVNDVLVSEKGLPASDPPSGIKDQAALSRPELEKAFKELEGPGAETKLKKICYDARSNLITTAEDMAKFCYYQVAFFKYRIDDRKFTSRTLREIPISRLMIRIMYLDPESTQRYKAGKPDSVRDQIGIECR